MEGMEDVTIHGDEGHVIKLASWAGTELEGGVVEPSVSLEFDGEELGCNEAALLLKNVKAQYAEMQVRALISKQAGNHKAIVHRKHKKAMLRTIGRKALKLWKMSRAAC